VQVSNFVPRGFGFVYHSIAILYHQVPNLSITIRHFFIAVGDAEGSASGSEAVASALFSLLAGTADSPGSSATSAEVRFCRYR
jgi:hypothetical protein